MHQRSQAEGSTALEAAMGLGIHTRTPSIHPSIEHVFQDMHHKRLTNVPPTALSSSIADRVWYKLGSRLNGLTRLMHGRARCRYLLVLEE